MKGLKRGRDVDGDLNGDEDGDEDDLTIVNESGDSDGGTKRLEGNELCSWSYATVLIASG
jgi:hypothetical protein